MPNAPIQITNESTDEYHRTYSAANGSYAFDDLAPGIYPCHQHAVLQLASFNETGIEIDVAERLFDIELKLGGSLDACADNPKELISMMRARQVIPDLPVPRVNGKPDLSGFWLMTNDPFPEQPKPHLWAAELFAERKGSFARDMLSARCLPGHPTGLLVGPSSFTHPNCW